TDIHHYGFAEEDSFDLGLMEESFAGSPFIDKKLSSRTVQHQGYPALEARYSLKDGGSAQVLYLIQGPHYYTLVARSKTPDPKAAQVVQSFSLKPLQYASARLQSDSLLRYSVQSPLPLYPQEKAAFPGSRWRNEGRDEEEELAEEETVHSRTVGSDSTGERIHVAFFRFPKYHYEKDTSWLNRDSTGDTESWILRSRRHYTTGNGMKVWEHRLGDTASSRMLWSRYYYKDGNGFLIRTLLDTLTGPSAFVQRFFDTFTPADTLQAMNIHEPKTALFFSDFFSADSVLHKKAMYNLDKIDLDSADLPLARKAIASLGWKERKYLETKTGLIELLGTVPTKAASDFLKDQYYGSGDTLELQYAALSALLAQKTPYAYGVFRNILVQEPPVLNLEMDETTAITVTSGYGAYNEQESFLNGLYDSLQLTRGIIKDLMPLLHIPDYKQPVMELMGTLVDSGLLSARDYETYLPQFLIEARQGIKKQFIGEKKNAIRKAQESTDEEVGYNRRSQGDPGNEGLGLYARLLVPFWEAHPQVPAVLQQQLTTSDQRLKLHTALLLARNKKPVPDSVWSALAAADLYRYELYIALKGQNQDQLFPKAYAGAEQLAIGKLLFLQEEERPDSIVLIKSQPYSYKGKNTTLYFFKYKEKKADNSWKIALADAEPLSETVMDYLRSNARYFVVSQLEQDFTTMTDTRIDEDQPLDEQLQKVLKRQVYSQHRSAARFYGGEDDRDWVFRVNE
ncbi:MAG TPA: hypothetical protein VHK69_11230, partial [Chitinophagaceae bacterium]|nr:hypothetical protein [Chitinophagaceae bacterium]